MDITPIALNKFTGDRWLRLLEQICLLCAVLLVIVWPLTGTIAARNLLLVLGCISSLLWMYRSNLIHSLVTQMPILCLIIVPIWLWIHYVVWPTDIAAQLYDLKGTWFRVILGVLMACGLGFMIANRPKIIYWIWIAIAILPIVSVCNYFQVSWVMQEWNIRNYHFPFKGKFALVNYLTYLSLFACAILHNNFTEQTNKNKLNYFIQITAILILIINYFIFLNAEALNGVLLLLIYGSILFIFFIKINKIDRSNFKKIFLITTVIVLLINIAWGINEKIFKDKISKLLEDIKISLDINTYTSWNEDAREIQELRPKRSDGTDVNNSTYSRLAWFVKGVDLINENPLGTGFSHRAFRYLVLNENPYSGVTITHSGWVDYGLGLGLPGVFATWFAMYLVVKRAFILTTNKMKNSNFIAYQALWVIGGAWIMWWILELSEREFIEQLFFLIALFATILKKG